MKFRILLTLLCPFLFGTLQAQIPNYVPANGLVGWWPFSGNAHDSSDEGNDLINVGATLTPDRHGNENKAFHFDGPEGNFLTTDNASFTFSPDEPFTVAFWVHNPSSTSGTVITSESDVENTFMWTCQTNNQGMMQFGTTKQGSPWIFANAAYSANQWTHVACTYEGQVMKIYVNGNNISSASYLYEGATSANISFHVGWTPDNGDFVGDIDDVGVWTRALNQNEIGHLHDACEIQITSQPENEEIVEGNSTSFAVELASNNAVYQWQVNDGSGFQDVMNGGQYQGATAQLLEISSVTLDNDNQLYRCVLTGSNCTDTTEVVSLTVLPLSVANAEQIAFNVFPNPANDFLKLMLDGNSLTNQNFKIFDQQGRVIKQGALRNENQTIQIGSLDAGMYLIQVGNGYSQRFTIAR